MLVRKIVTFLIFTCSVMTMEAQSLDERLLLFRNDGNINVFFRSDLDSIVFERYSMGEKVEEESKASIYWKGGKQELSVDQIDFLEYSPSDMPLTESLKSIVIPEQPRLAMLHITGIDAIPNKKNVGVPAWVEVMTGTGGTFFKKKAVIKLQGSTAAQFLKKGFSVEFCEDDWVGDETTDVKIGSWVTQDSYHFKAYYTSYTKGECPVAYKLYDKFMACKPEGHRAPFNDYGIVDDEARCCPDGFPCLVYLNNQFYGIYSWQLKKHRDNYHQKRNETANIHLDGFMGPDELWHGKVSWTSFEVRNPKPKASKWTLLCQDGMAYDGDMPSELMGKDSPYYDDTDINCVNSAAVKQSILSLSSYMGEIEEYETAYKAASESGRGDIQLLKSEIEKRFSVEYLIDYVILVNLLHNTDGMAKNWQWLTWGDIGGTMRWYVCPYDFDSSFGVVSTTAFKFFSARETDFGRWSKTPARYVWDYYLDEMKARYRELRDANVISFATIWGLVEDWTDRIGPANYAREIERWPETPANRKDCISPLWKLTGTEYLTFTDAPSNWSMYTVYSQGALCKYNFRCYRSAQGNNQNHAPNEANSEWWEDMTVAPGTYHEGDIVYDGRINFYQFQALADIEVVRDEADTLRYDHLAGAPFEKLYTGCPYEGGVYDSPERIRQWIQDKIAIMDKQMGYE